MQVTHADPSSFLNTKSITNSWSKSKSRFVIFITAHTTDSIRNKHSSLMNKAINFKGLSFDPGAGIIFKSIYSLAGRTIVIIVTFSPLLYGNNPI